MYLKIILLFILILKINLYGDDNYDYHNYLTQKLEQVRNTPEYIKYHCPPLGAQIVTEARYNKNLRKELENIFLSNKEEDKNISFWLLEYYFGAKLPEYEQVLQKIAEGENTLSTRGIIHFIEKDWVPQPLYYKILKLIINNREKDFLRHRAKQALNELSKKEFLINFYLKNNIFKTVSLIEKEHFKIILKSDEQLIRTIEYMFLSLKNSDIQKQRLCAFYFPYIIDDPRIITEIILECALEDTPNIQLHLLAKEYIRKKNSSKK